MPDVPKDFFTTQSTLTLAGATAATFVVCNGLQKAFNFNPRWLALAISQTISLCGVYFNHGMAADYFIGLLNGFLIFATVAGTNQIVGSETPRVSRGRQIAKDAVISPGVSQVQAKRSFLSSWF